MVFHTRFLNGEGVVLPFPIVRMLILLLIESRGLEETEAESACIEDLGDRHGVGNGIQAENLHNPLGGRSLAKDILLILRIDRILKHQSSRMGHGLVHSPHGHGWCFRNNLDIGLGNGIGDLIINIRHNEWVFIGLRKCR